MTKKLDINKGFTLIEVLIAMAVIAIGIFAMMSVIIVVIKSNTQSKDITVATNLVQLKMEEILNMTYGSITTSNDDIGTYTGFLDCDKYTFIDDDELKDCLNGTYTTSLDNTHIYGLEVNITDMGINAKTIIIDAFWNPATTTSSHKIELQSIVAQ